MSIPNAEKDILNFAESGANKIPSTLNVLTILTFIGCAITLLSTIAMPYLMKFSLSMMDKVVTMDTDLSASQLKEMQKGRTAIEIVMKNMAVIMITSFVGIILCFWGALWMRKLKKDGYWIYIAGQVIPIVAGALIMGKYQFIDWKNYFNYIIPVVFIILYSIQRKYLIR